MNLSVSTLKEQKSHDSQLFSRDTHYSRDDYQRKHPAGTRHPRNVPWRSQKVLMSGTYKGPSGDSQGANTKLDGFEKNCFSEVIVLVLHVCFIFYRKSKYSKVLNGDVHRTSTGPSCVTSMEPNDGRPWDVGQSCFFKLNSQTR